MSRCPLTDDTAHAPRETRDTERRSGHLDAGGPRRPLTRSLGGTGGVAAPVPPGEPLPWGSPGAGALRLVSADTGLAGLDAHVDRLARLRVGERDVHAADRAAAAVDRVGPALGGVVDDGVERQRAPADLGGHAARGAGLVGEDRAAVGQHAVAAE